MAAITAASDIRSMTLAEVRQGQRFLSEGDIYIHAGSAHKLTNDDAIFGVRLRDGAPYIMEPKQTVDVIFGEVVLHANEEE